MCTARFVRYAVRLFAFIWILVISASFDKAATAQTLRVNSGINPSDTYVVFDLTEQSSGSITLPQALYNPTTRTSSNVLTVSPANRTLHVELGYDTSGGNVANIYVPTSSSDPNKTSVSPISSIRFAKGQVALFDQNNAQLPLVLPSSAMSQLWPLNLLGTAPGPSLTSQLAVSNLQTVSSQRNATVRTSGATAQMVMPPRSGGSQVVWNYAQNPNTSMWVAQSVTVTPSTNNGSTSRTLSFANLGWYTNASADSARAQAASTRQARPSSNTATPASITSMNASTSSSCNPNAYQVNVLGGSRNIAFQHGFTSNPCTWSRMVPWLNQDFVFGTELVAQTDSTSGIALQAQTLQQQLQSAGGSNYILVGHSAGGLVARSVAQQFQGTQNAVRGVATLNTPHLGADFALTGPVALGAGLQFLSTDLYGWLGCDTAYDNGGCFFSALTFTGAYNISDWAVDSIHAINDFTPGSSFLNNLNAQQENFTQAAVIGYTPQRWLISRELDEIVSGKLGVTCNPEDPCGERAAAAGTEFFYDAVEVDLAINVFLELYYGDDDPELEQMVEDAILWDGTVLFYMDAIDFAYDLVMAPSLEGSDGLVQISSQYYPYSTATQWPILGADSHGGAPKSNLDRAALDAILAQQFGVQTTASCSCTTNPSAVAFTGGGGTSTITVSTSPGCGWSAVSTQPWLAITSGATGTGNGSFTISAQANPLNLPRSSTVTVGGAKASTTLNVSEAGQVSSGSACTYTLSPSGTIAVSSGGQTGTISVSTQVGCAWSASPTVSWLTVTANPTGTGSGSFQYTAAPNTSTMDMLGSITVEDQTAHFLQGTQGGGPGTGTITISGSPSYAYPKGCPPGYCSQIVQGGAVIVYINGQSFGAGYGGPSDTATSVAAELASSINSGNSLVTASVSGSTVTVTSILNGSSTNYSLSTSVNFDNSNFSSPSFVGSPSGSTLTGGH